MKETQTISYLLYAANEYNLGCIPRLTPVSTTIFLHIGGSSEAPLIHSRQPINGIDLFVVA